MINTLNTLARWVHDDAKRNGWRDSDRNDGELIHLGLAFEELRRVLEICDEAEND